MQTPPAISICIPAYKHVEFLQRLLDSIALQTFTDYEVVITDDSPDVGLQVFLHKNYTDARIKYYKNQKVLGSPENWNESMRKATGDWIKMMHDDDWFASPTALESFFKATTTGNHKFICSAFYRVDLDNDVQPTAVIMSENKWQSIQKQPINLYANNCIGHPSVSLIKRSVNAYYDSRMTWLVDLDYYIGLIKKYDSFYINQPLVKIGMSAQQLTAQIHHRPEIEIPEALLLQSKYTVSTFGQIKYFDAWWRLCRNHKIRSIELVNQYANSMQVPEIIFSIINFQKHWPQFLLRFGPASKTLMGICWLINKP